MPRTPLTIQNGAVSVAEHGGQITLENGQVRVVINGDGTLSSFFDKAADRELIDQKAKGNQYMMYEDIPMYWDAWDVDVYHLEKRQDVKGKDAKAVVLEKGPLRASVQVSFALSSKSTLKQTISLSAISPRFAALCDRAE